MTTHCYECEREKLGDMGGLVSGSHNELCEKHRQQKALFELDSTAVLLARLLFNNTNRTKEDDELLESLQRYLFARMKQETEKRKDEAKLSLKLVE